MPNNPNTQETAQEPALDEINTKPLPECFYCDSCGDCLFKRGIGYSAETTGNEWGIVTIYHNDIDREYQDQETNECGNFTYTCNNCDTEVTEKVTQIQTFLSKVLDKINETAEYDPMEDPTYRINHRAIRLENNTIGSIGSMSCRFVTRIIIENRPQPNTIIDNTDDYIVSPYLIETIEQVANENPEFSFNKNAPIYAKAKLILQKVLEREQAQINARRTTETSEPQTTLTHNALYNAVRHLTENENLQDQEDDPENSRIIENRHHHRWRELDLTNFFTCEHCNYLFEANTELETATCPSCKKDTKNANA